MSYRELAPRLSAASVIRLRREGGVAHMPGLASARWIHCERCSAAQRVELQALLDELVACASCPLSGADRRVLHLTVGRGDESANWTLSVAEDSVPEALLQWWRRAVSDPLASDQDDET